MYTEHNVRQTIAILVTTALLLIAMAPTLAHAATYLQGTAVNTNTLVQDAYVAVTYYDSKGKQKLAKGWIDAIGDSTFTIRSGGIRNRTVIAYDSVIAVIMSDESTVPVKQMNDVNRFIRENNKEEILKQPDKKNSNKWSAGFFGGVLLGATGGLIGFTVAEDCPEDGDFCGPGFAAVSLGYIGYVIGVPIGVSIVSSDPIPPMLGSGMGVVAGWSMTTTLSDKLWPSVLICPLIGAVMMSELSDAFKVRRFSVGLAPNSDGRLSAIATFRF